MSKLREAYEKFCEQGESGRANVNDLLRAIVDAIDPEKPSPKKKE